VVGVHYHFDAGAVVIGVVVAAVAVAVVIDGSSCYSYSAVLAAISNARL
jgi:hypothetical protein